MTRLHKVRGMLGRLSTKMGSVRRRKTLNWSSLTKWRIWPRPSAPPSSVSGTCAWSSGHVPCARGGQVVCGVEQEESSQTVTYIRLAAKVGASDGDTLFTVRPCPASSQPQTASGMSQNSPRTGAARALLSPIAREGPPLITWRRRRRHGSASKRAKRPSREQR